MIVKLAVACPHRTRSMSYWRSWPVLGNAQLSWDTCTYRLENGFSGRDLSGPHRHLPSLSFQVFPNNLLLECIPLFEKNAFKVSIV